MTKTLRFPLTLALSLGIAGLTLPAAIVRAADALGKASWSLLSPKGGADLTTAPGKVLHVAVHHAVPQYYQLQLTHDIAAALPAGKSLHYQFSARSATKNPIHVVIEKRTAPYTHYLDKTVTLTPAWKPYAFNAPIPMAYAPGDWPRACSSASRRASWSSRASQSARPRDDRTPPGWFIIVHRPP